MHEHNKNQYTPTKADNENFPLIGKLFFAAKYNQSVTDLESLAKAVDITVDELEEKCKESLILKEIYEFALTLIFDRRRLLAQTGFIDFRELFLTAHLYDPVAKQWMIETQQKYGKNWKKHWEAEIDVAANDLSKMFEPTNLPCS